MTQGILSAGGKLPQAEQRKSRLAKRILIIKLVGRKVAEAHRRNLAPTESIILPIDAALKRSSRPGGALEPGASISLLFREEAYIRRYGGGIISPGS